MRIIQTVFSIAIVALPAAIAQPGPNQAIDCRGETCTFTLAFVDGLNNPQPAITGAPYTGQVSREVARTLPNGTHTSVTQADPLTYRDSQGRVRTELPVYPNRPDSFTAVKLLDPVAGFQYMLDPVTRVAHRMPFKPDYTATWQPSSAEEWSKPFKGTGRGGTTSTREPLGTKTISGVATVGYRTTESGTNPRGLTMIRSGEQWMDPRTGEALLSKNINENDEMTATMLHYNAAEPDPALFKIPDGYKVVDETGPFQVVHPRVDPSAPGMVNLQRAGLSANGDRNSCTVTFTPATGAATQMVERAITGAPYSGQETFERAAVTLPNGTVRPGNTSVMRATARDKYGRLRTDPAPMTGGPGRGCPGRLALVEILDPVAGSRYVLDTAAHVAYRIPYQAEPGRYEPGMMGPNVGPRTLPNGVTVLDEYLARKVVLGVTAVGHRTTRTSPPGTYMGNDKPVVDITETWTDPQTGILLISKQSGPNGDVVRSVPDYKGTDPDPALFKIPEGYKVIDETDKFSFIVPVQN